MLRAKAHRVQGRIVSQPGIKLITLRSPEFIGSTPTEREIWISILDFCMAVDGEKKPKKSLDEHEERPDDLH